MRTVVKGLFCLLGILVVILVLVAYITDGRGISYILSFLEILVILAVVGLIIYAEWKIGTAVGKAITKGTGFILGIILIFIVFTLPAGVAIIMYREPLKTLA